MTARRSCRARSSRRSRIDLRQPETFHTISRSRRNSESRRYAAASAVIVEAPGTSNRLFATIEAVRKPSSGWQCRVVISTPGRPPRRSPAINTVTAIVLNGSRGVWKDPLLPANTVQHLCRQNQIIPTVNFILKWVRGDRRDELEREPVGNLADHQGASSRRCRSPCHAHRLQKAPMIQRFGDVRSWSSKTPIRWQRLLKKSRRR